ncbi:MULE transposase domain containing protein [Nitzschia inconspicua]|nr:MULE transposase domain containing protein [Nitzschia inconspicua]
MRDGLQPYAKSRYRFISAACYDSHFFVVDITFDNRQPNVFERVNVFDSLSSTARRRATAVLHQVQKFLSGFCFYKLGHHQSVLQDPDYIMQMAEFRHCPVQTNGYDCGLFALAVVWHLLCDKDIHPSVFTQADIDTFRVALRHGLSSNPGWATMDNIACYFPVLSMPAPPPPPSPPAIEISPPSFTSVGDAQLAVCGPRSFEVANVATERNTDAGPGMEFGPTEEPGQEQDPILDYEDNYFQDNFSSKGVVFGTVDDVLVAINEYQESSGNVLSTVRTRGNARTFVCISHANCTFCVKFGPMPKQEGIFYKPENCTIRHRGAKVVYSKSGKRFKKRCKELLRGIVSDVAAHKHGPPTAMDVMKTGVHKKKTHLQYYQCYRGVREWKARKEITDPMSFQLLGPYVERFREQNPGSRAVMERGNDNRVKRLFICPPFSNEALLFVRPVASLDAAHMKSEWKGTLYIATVKSAMDKIYPIAFAITADNENGQGWDWVLRNLDAGLPNLTIAHYRVGCAYKLFLLQSDRQKGLDEACKACFPANHHCYCAVHIRRNVEGRHGKKIGALIPGLAKTTSLPDRDAKLAQLRRQSPPAYDFVKKIDPKQWMDSAWLQDDTLPPRYGVRSSNISESANSMFERERSGNWLEAIDGILKKMSLRIQASREEYERKTGVVESVYPQILDRWEKGIGYRVVDSGGDGQKYSVHRIIEGNTGSNQSFTLNWVDGVCECGVWQMHGIPCVHGMAYFRWRNDWTLQQVVEQFVEKCHTYDYEQKLYSGSFVPVCMDMLQPDQTTLPPDIEGKRMAGRPKTVRLRLRSRYSHRPEKSPIVCSRCHQRGHNARTCQRRAALAKNTGNADTAQNSNSVL